MVETAFILMEETSPSKNNDLVYMIINQLSVIEKIPVSVCISNQPATEFAIRLICSNSNLNISNIKEANLKAGDWGKIMTSASVLMDAPIFIDEIQPKRLVDAHRLTKNMGIEEGIAISLETISKQK